MTEITTELPPGPSRNVFACMGLYWRGYRKPYDAVLELQEQYGDPITVRMLGTGNVVFTGKPEYVKEVFAMSPDHFTMMDTPRIEFFFGKRSLFTSEGDIHQRDKKMIFPHFRGERMREYANTIVECTRKLCDAHVDQGTSSLMQIAQFTTIEVMLQALLGVRKQEHLEHLTNVFMGWNNAQTPLSGVPALHHNFFGFGPYATLMRYNRQLCSFIDMLIKENRAGEGGEDILSLLVRSKYDDGTSMEDEHITDHIRTLLVAGFDTTANTIAWGIDTLFRHPSLLKTLRDELDGLPADADFDDISKLPWLDATCYELMRLRPPLELIPTRRLSKPLRLGPYELQPGTGVMPCPIMAQRDPTIYEDPNELKPERFLGKRPNVFEYFPFGGGRRLCAGYAFANYQLRLVIGTVLREYNVELAGPPPVPKRYSVVVGPKGDAPAVISRRKR